MLEGLANILMTLINWLILGVATVLGWIMAIFPDSPFRETTGKPKEIELGYITWLFDFPTWLQHLTLLLMAIGGYYAVRVIARWIKLARG